MPKSSPKTSAQAPAPEKSSDPLVKLRDALTKVIFQEEARRTQQRGRKNKPTPKNDAIIETLRYVWDAVEAATK